MYRNTCLVCCRLAVTANRRSFISSAIIAADPSTASTSSSVIKDAQAPLHVTSSKQQTKSRIKRNSSAKGKERESLTDVLRSQTLPDDENGGTEALKAPEGVAIAEDDGPEGDPVPAKVQGRGRRKPGKKQARKNRMLVAVDAATTPANRKQVVAKGNRKSSKAAKKGTAAANATDAEARIGALRPTSESGFSISSDYRSKQDPFHGETAEAAVVAKMKELMQPLLQRCFEEKGTQKSKDFVKLRDALKNFVKQYGQIRKQKKQLEMQERFVRKIEASKWHRESDAAGDQPGGAPAILEQEAHAKSAEPGSKDTALDDSGNSSTISKAETANSSVAQNRLHNLQVLQKKSISADEVIVTPVAPLHDAQVASLAHGLERILFNPGTHWLQDPRTGIYNFPEEVQKIPDVEDFDFSRLPTFMRPSQDPDLRDLLRKSGKTFAGSTSSLTSVLSQIYFALNGQKPLNTQSQSFVNSPRDFSAGVRLPASVIVRRTEEGQYLIDADKAADVGGDNVLSEKGHILEKMLTYPPEEFERFLRASKNPLLPEESRDKKEAYHYSSTSSLLMRSQLDCHDKRLPRQTFDIKTRGSIALRRDMLNHFRNSGYTIDKTTGDLESLEREKYDLIRSAFLKYSMQVRIGAMDGIFLAYHSGERIFGFEYLSLEDLDKCISGSHEESEQAFRLCLGTMETLLERAVHDIPGESLRVSFEAFNGGLQVYAQPLSHDQPQSTTHQENNDKHKHLLPGDLSRPLLLYDVQFANYLNGFELRKSENVNFLTWRDPPPPDQSVNTEESKVDDTTSSVSAFERVYRRLLDGSEEESLPAPPARQPITWSTLLDIALSTDAAFNQLRLAKLRKRQAKFTTQVILPEGLTQAEIAFAVKGVTPEEEQQAIAEGEKGGWCKGRFVPRAGIQYVQRTYGIVGELRRLAKAGREKLESKQ